MTIETGVNAALSAPKDIWLNLKTGWAVMPRDIKIGTIAIVVLALISRGTNSYNPGIIHIVSTLGYHGAGLYTVTGALVCMHLQNQLPVSAPTPVQVAKPTPPPKVTKPKEPPITDIHTACEKGDLKVLEELLKNGADIKQEKDGFLPLHYACQAGHLPVVEYLVGKGADIHQWTNAPHDHVYTPLLLACEKGHCEVAEYLLKNGASPNQATMNGMAMALHQVGWKNPEKMTKLLIEHGASLGSKDRLGRTPLHLRGENTSRILIDAGSVIDAKDNKGRTPQQTALEEGDFDLAAFFEREQGKDSWRKASVHERKSDGYSDQTSTYIYDNQNADLYREEISPLKFRAKSLMVSALSPLFALKVIGSNLIHIVSDIASAVKKKFTISLIWDIPAAILTRIYRAAESPLLGIAMMFVGIYGIFDPMKARKAMNQIEAYWKETGLLNTSGMQKVGNLAESQVKGYAQFRLNEWIKN